MTPARRLALLVAVAAPLTGGGCRGGELPGGGVSDTLFVRTMVDLRRVQSDATLDSAGRAEARREVLEKHRVTPAQLEEAAGELADEPERVSQLWQEVERRLATDAMRSGQGRPEASQP